MAGQVLDIFGTSAFDTLALTTAINKAPYTPRRIGQMGLFNTKGVMTPHIAVEERDGLLALLPTVVRGGPATVAKRAKRTVRDFTCPHIPYEDTIKASDIEGIRAFGSESRLKSVAGMVNDQLTQMRNDHEATLEHLRMGAIHGVILDADGATTLYNLFTEFGTSEVTRDFDFANESGTTPMSSCMYVKRQIEIALGNAPYTRIHALCSDTFFDSLITHSTVVTAYALFQSGSVLRSDVRNAFEFAGIFFENYRGSIDGVSFITAGSARFFPVGVPNLFTTYFAPADFIETVNTLGRPVYAKQARLEFDRGIKIHTQSNPLPLCHRPRCLVGGTIT